MVNDLPAPIAPRAVIAGCFTEITPSESVTETLSMTRLTHLEGKMTCGCQQFMP